MDAYIPLCVSYMTYLLTLKRYTCCINTLDFTINVIVAGTLRETEQLPSITKREAMLKGKIAIDYHQFNLQNYISGDHALTTCHTSKNHAKLSSGFAKTDFFAILITSRLSFAWRYFHCMVVCSNNITIYCSCFCQ